MIYDENARNKPLETIEDAIMYIAAQKWCGACSVCAANTYGCNDENRARAYGILTGTEKVIKNKGANEAEQEREVYRKMSETLEAYSKKEAKKNGACETCMYSRMHSSGILWCNSFGNFVHGDGYCYRYWDSEASK